jgi:hypothetical protein
MVLHPLGLNLWSNRHTCELLPLGHLTGACSQQLEVEKNNYPLI